MRAAGLPIVLTLTIFGGCAASGSLGQRQPGPLEPEGRCVEARLEAFTADGLAREGCSVQIRDEYERVTGATIGQDGTARVILCSRKVIAAWASCPDSPRTSIGQCRVYATKGEGTRVVCTVPPPWHGGLGGDDFSEEREGQFALAMEVQR